RSNLDARLLKGSEAGGLRADGVCAGSESVDDIRAVIIRRGSLLRAARVNRRDGRADNHAAELICDATAQRAVSTLLRKCDCGNQNEHERQDHALLYQS